LDCANAEWNIVLGLNAHGGDWLSFEHLWRLGLLALVDLAVLANLVGVIP
jgi:hypothetical protein